MAVLTPAAPSAIQRPTHLYFCAWMVAGVRTQYENVRGAAVPSDDLALHFVEINPYKQGGLIERLPLLGSTLKGSLRSFACSLPLFWSTPLDALWTQADTAVFPFLATRARLGNIPYAISTDATNAQIERMDAYGMPASGEAPSFKRRVRDGILAYCYHHASLVLPWSRWAADAIVDEYHVPEDRIVVLPPGVDLRQWAARRDASRPDVLPRLLFVGGDFARKGGPLLLEVYRGHLRGRCELHLVTRDGEADEPGVFVYHDLGPNDPRLHALYETCDALVLPTRADCFSLASIEAMASGLPVITCPVGGIPEIVSDGESGWLVPVDDGEALRAACEALLADLPRAQAMGMAGRAIVEARFDAARNAETAFELLRQRASRQHS